MIRRHIAPFAPGDLLTAGRLNQLVDVANTISQVLPPRQIEPPAEAEYSTDDQTARDSEVLDAVVGEPEAEEWTFLAAETATERLEDDTDSSVYIDITRTTAVRVQTADGRTVRIPLEAEA